MTATTPISSRRSRQFQKALGARMLLTWSVFITVLVRLLALCAGCGRGEFQAYEDHGVPVRRKQFLAFGLRRRRLR